MTANDATEKAADTVAERLQGLGVRGVLVQMAQRGQLIELRCEMPKCYCRQGRVPSTQNRSLPAHGNHRRTTTRGLSPMADTSSRGTSGSRTLSAIERMMAGE